jgi:hypothetical protein
MTLSFSENTWEIKQTREMEYIRFLFAIKINISKNFFKNDFGKKSLYYDQWIQQISVYAWHIDFRVNTNQWKYDKSNPNKNLNKFSKQYYPTNYHFNR